MSMAGIILSWFSALEVRALNTYQSEECNVNGIVDDKCFWTCGTKRKLPQRMQIDFLAASLKLTGKCFPVTFDAKIFQGSDHTPIVGELVITGRIVEKPERILTLKGWAPESEEHLEEFQR